ncbi:hypothetical protein C4D60_Mb07t12100 [Musa balbisiana]|uniref:Uncharacterized protein n=1 Tax=Musa balbisiana TaxID=52838 RepID=A0A4S8JEQ2_MUSBA|nr:hypothetical protein C4D60_Mb07t12100 [Musa balbisiana]
MQAAKAVAVEEGRHHRSLFAAIEEEDTTIEEAVRECFPPCMATTESVCCRQQIGEGVRPAKKSKVGDEEKEWMSKAKTVIVIAGSESVSWYFFNDSA